MNETSNRKNTPAFQIYTPMDGVYHIQDLFGVCATLIVGSREALLVDTCTGCGDLKETVEMLTDKPLRVVNTHSHLDHSGGDYQFPEVLLDPVEIRLGRRYMESMDVRPSILGRMDQLGYAMDERRKEQYLSYKMENAAPLPRGGIDLGGLHVLPVKLPSHTPGMTGFLVEERKLLLGGDSVCRMACLHLPEAGSLEAHLCVLREAAKLPFSHILTSHSRELLDREDLEAMIECAEHFDPEQTYGYRDPFYPRFRGRMFLYESQKNRHAIVVKREN